MKRILIATVLSATLMVAYAQSYELRIVEKGQYAHVQLRNLQEKTMRNAENKVTDVVFGVKWRDSGIDYLEMVPGSYKMVASGSVLDKGGYRFQAFGAMQTPYAIPVDWKQGAWTDIAVLKIAGEGQRGPVYRARLELAEDGFHVTTGPNIGIDLYDETPQIVPYHVHDIATAPHTPAAPWGEIDLRVTKYGPKHSHLTWGVETPETIEGYVIERKIGEDAWKDLAQIISEGQYVHVYVDEDAYDGVRQQQAISYRIRVMDERDERRSEIKTLDFSAQKMIVEVFPNPAADKVQVEMTATETGGAAYLELYATDGRLVYRNEILGGSVREMIDLAAGNVESGSYTVNLVSGGKILDTRSLHVMR